MVGFAGQILLMLQIVFTGVVFGQSAAPILTVEADRMGGAHLGPWLSYVRHASTDFDWVQSHWESLSVEIASGPVVKLGRTDTPHWLRLRLFNPTDQRLPLVLEHPYPSDSVWIYFRQNDGSWHEERLGLREKGTGQFRYRNVAVRLDLQPGVHTVFFRLNHAGANKFPLRLWSLDRFISVKVWEEVIIGVFLGVMGVMVLYNAFVFLTIRNLAYLSYVGMLISSILWLFFYSGIGRFLPEPLATFCGEYWRSLMTAMVGFLLIFTLKFLDVRNLYPRLFRLILGLIAIAFSMPLFEWIDPFLAFNLSMLVINAALPACLFVAMYSAYKRYRPAWFYLASFLVLISGGLIESAVTMDLIGPEFGFWPIFFSLSLQTILLSLAIGDQIYIKEKTAQQNIEKLNHELQHHVVFIQEIVAEKTRDIYSILNTIQQGIFTICMPIKSIHKDFSPYLELIFGRPIRTQEPALDYLFQDAILGPDQRQQYESVVDLILGADSISYELNQQSLPKEIVRSQPQNQRQILELDWSPILDRSGRVEKLLVTVRDVTQVRKLEKSHYEQKNTLEALQELLEVGAERSARGLRELDSLYQDCMRIFRSMHDDDSDAWRRLAIHLHTMKGCARSMQMRQLCDALHEAESKCLNRAQGDLNILGSLRDLLVTYKQIYRSLFGGHALNTSDVILAADVERIVRQIRNSPQITVQTIATSLASLLYRDVESVLRECFEGIGEIAQDLGKFEPLVHVQADQILVSREEERVIKQAFIHLIRNSLEHGIELPDQRLARGKDPQGHIYIDLVPKNEALHFSYWDDGYGLNLEAIRAKAMELGLVQQGVELAREELIQLIFRDGFSTARRLSYEAGRGIGMEAIREYFQARGGEVRIRLVGDPVDGFQAIRFEAILPSPQAQTRGVA